MTVVDAAGITDIGKRKSNNEDTFLIDDAMNLYAVADGMGGHKAGEVASRMMIDILHDYMQNSTRNGDVKNLIGSDRPVSKEAKQIIAGINKANRNVYNASHENSDRRGMGTTISVVFFTNGTMIAGNVGDSPIYLVRNKKIKLISTLHTVMAEQEALAPRGAKPLGKQFRHMLTRAVGTRETVRVDTREIKYRNGDSVIICSDGLSDLVTSEEILQKVQENQPEKSTEMLTDLANERGGDDNITVIVLKLSGEPETTYDLEDDFIEMSTPYPNEEEKIPVEYDTDDASYKGFAYDLNTTGTFIVAHESFFIGQEVTLTFTPDKIGVPLMISGRVTNRLSSGIIVSFTDITQQQKDVIKSIVSEEY